MDHLNGQCPVCHKSFGKGDDVVICPECGAPYHRECYLRAGHCVFEDRHGTGFEFRTPEQEKLEAAGADAGPATSGMLCKNCHTVNDARNIFCEKCGAPLHGPGPARQEPKAGSVWPPISNAAPSFYGQTLYGSPVDYSGEIDGISKRDWADYIGKSAPIYIQRLSQMSRQGGAVGFVLSAMFFGPLYFAYRKMWGWAALRALLSLLFSIPGFLVFLANNGMQVFSSAHNDLLSTLSGVAYLLNLAVMILSGLFALQLYRMGTRKKIRALKEQYAAESDYRTALIKKGNVCIPGVVVAAVVILLLYILIFLLSSYHQFGDTFLQAINNYVYNTYG